MTQRARGTTSEWERLTTATLAITVVYAVYELCLIGSYAIHGSTFRFPGSPFITLVIGVAGIVLWRVWYSRTRSVIVEARGNADDVLRGRLLGRSLIGFLVAYIAWAIVVFILLLAVDRNFGRGVSATAHAVAGLVVIALLTLWFLDIRNVRTRMRAGSWPSAMDLRPGIPQIASVPLSGADEN